MEIVRCPWNMREVSKYRNFVNRKNNEKFIHIEIS